MNRSSMEKCVHEALKRLGGRATVVQVTRDIWQVHEIDLRASGDFFFKWQYEVRWGVAELRKKGIMKPASKSAK